MLFGIRPATKPTFAAAACDGSATPIKVVKRIDGSTDTALCPSGTKAASYPYPARLYCLERLETDRTDSGCIGHRLTANFLNDSDART